MLDSYWLILAGYVIASLTGLAICKQVAIKCSGKAASTSWFWLSIVLTVFWGIVQLNVANAGYVIFFEETKQYLEENELARLSALIVTLLLTGCTPRPERNKSIL